MATLPPRGILYLIACGSSAATEIVEPGVRAAQEVGWEVCVITTPSGRNFLNMPRLAQLTGHPVRSEYKLPDTPDLLPRADALLVYPASFRTINTWAVGDSATLAVGLLCEYLGLKAPIVAVPCIGTGSGLDTHPAFLEHLAKLKAWGVRILYQPEKYPPRNAIPAPIVLEELDRLLLERQTQPPAQNG
jgi:phosphopantothenoylcysteine synthetase/decarboxylase